MGKVILNDTTLTSIADAIRSKNGETGQYLPAEMPAKIEAIETGGGGDFKPVSLKYARNQSSQSISDSTYYDNFEQDASKNLLDLTLATNGISVPGKNMGDVAKNLLLCECYPISINGMFYGLSSSRFDICDFSNWDLSNIIDATGAFYNCYNLKTLSMPENSNRNFKNLKKTSQMFWGCSKLVDPDFSKCDFRNIEDAQYMFSGCSNINSITFPEINTMSNKLINTSYMFDSCKIGGNLELKFDASGITTADYMFKDLKCKKLDMSNLNFSNLKKFSYWFGGYAEIGELILPDLPVVTAPNLFSSSGMKIYNIKFKEGASFGMESTASTVTLDFYYIWRGYATTTDPEGVTYEQRFIDFSNSIAPNTSGKTRTIKLYKTLYNSLSDEQKALLIDKGYTLSYSS